MEEANMRLCKAADREVTAEELENMLGKQKVIIPEEKTETGSAFEKALKGSKAFLKHNGLL